MSDAAVMVEAHGLRKVFKGRRGDRTVAVDDLTMTCRAGEVFGLLGPNGAGKTTSLRMLSTVYRPTEGRAVIDGADVVREPERVRRSIGFLSGNTGLYPRLSAREVLTYFGRLYDMSDDAIAARIDELAGLLAMDFLDKRCDKMSTGMKQKVNIARTVIHDPPVLVLDEPTSGLDVLAARTIVEFVRDCRTRGKCVVFSTHIMSEAERLCDRVAVIHNGRMQFDGTLEQMRSAHGPDLEDAFVAVLEAA